jgi:hypothetical protein
MVPGRRGGQADGKGGWAKEGPAAGELPGLGANVGRVGVEPRSRFIEGDDANMKLSQPLSSSIVTGSRGLAKCITAVLTSGLTLCGPLPRHSMKPGLTRRKSSPVYRPGFVFQQWLRRFWKLLPEGSEIRCACDRLR